MKSKIVILIVSIFFVQISANTGGGLSFLNIASSGKMNALGNTMFSDLGSPSATLLNPANTWSTINQNISFNTVIFNQALDAQINHMFLGFKIKNSQLTIGSVKYGISNIESYDQEGVFQQYFDFSDLAFILGFSYRVSNIYWGLSTSLITENFSNVGYERTYFYQYDIGFSYTNIPLKIIDFSLGASMKNVFDSKFNLINSMNSNNILGTMITYNNRNFAYKGYFDVLFQKILGVYSGRFGSEFQYNYKNYLTSLYLGYNDFRFTPLDVFSLSETNQYNSQLKWGIGFKIPLNTWSFNFVYAQSLPGKDTRMDSKFMTISINRKNNN